MKTLDVITFILMVIGGLNWGLVGLFNIDVVAGIFGSPEALGARIVYTLVGLSSLYQLLAVRAITQRWSGFGGGRRYATPA